MAVENEVCQNTNSTDGRVHVEDTMYISQCSLIHAASIYPMAMQVAHESPFTNTSFSYRQCDSLDGIMKSQLLVSIYLVLAKYSDRYYYMVTEIMYAKWLKSSAAQKLKG